MGGDDERSPPELSAPPGGFPSRFWLDWEALLNGMTRRARDGEEKGREEWMSPRRGRRGVDSPDLRAGVHNGQSSSQDLQDG